jgi:predicted transposase YdaD
LPKKKREAARGAKKQQEALRRTKKQQEVARESKQFDSLVKALFGEQSEEAIASLIAEVCRPEGKRDEELNVELNRTTLSIDIGRHMIYKGESITLDLEAQVRANEDLLPRMDEYRINLYRKYKQRPVLSVLLLLFEGEVPQTPFQIICGGEVRSAFYPIIICLWEKDPYRVVQEQQWCLYPFLPAMKEPTVELLTQVVREMEGHDSRVQFERHLAWFQTMLGRTTTITEENKQKIREVLTMQYQGYELFREDPVIGGMILEGELKGKMEGEIEGLREAILDIVDDLFPSPVVVPVQQAINTSQDKEQLRKFLRDLVRLSDEQEVLALLTQCFPVA